MFLEEDPEVEIGFQILRMNSDGLLKGFQGFCITILKIEQDSEIVKGLLIEGIDLDRLLIGLISFVKITDLLIEETQIVVSLKIGRV